MAARMTFSCDYTRCKSAGILLSAIYSTCYSLFIGNGVVIKTVEKFNSAIVSSWFELLTCILTVVKGGAMLVYCIKNTE